MKTIAFVFLIMLSAIGFSQATLGIGSGYTLTPSTVSTPSVGGNYNDTITISCYVKNTGSTVFTGTVSLFRRVTALPFQSTDQKMIIFNTALNPNDSIYITFIDSLLPNTYKQNGNGNTVVVWPISTSAIPSDTLYTAPVYVTNLTGIKELDKYALYIYPNPVSQKLFIKPDPSVHYEQIRIYDMEMKLITQSSFTENIDIRALSAGTYIIQVSTDKGINFSSRFVKTD